MYYLKNGLAKYGYVNIGKILAVIFAILCIGGSFGGGNMFQANQAYAQLWTIPNFVRKWSNVWFSIGYFSWSGNYWGN